MITAIITVGVVSYWVYAVNFIHFMYPEPS